MNQITFPSFSVFAFGVVLYFLSLKGKSSRRKSTRNNAPAEEEDERGAMKPEALRKKELQRVKP